MIKTNNSVTIIKNLTNVNFYKGVNKINKYITIHYTANDGDTAKGNSNYFKSVNRGSSANYFVDENNIVQVVDDMDSSWSVGVDYSKGKAPYWNKCTNYNSISIEMCSRKDSKGDYYIKDETVENTIKLVKYLCEKHNIPYSNVLRHYDVCGKICPKPFVDSPSKWLEFKKALEVKKVEEKIYKRVEDVPNYAKDSVKWAIENKILLGNGTSLDLKDNDIKTLVFLHRYNNLKGN